MAENTIVILKAYFGVTAKEMMDFWKSLTDEEKDYYKHADLS
jgi:hypothetical protein